MPTPFHRQSLSPLGRELGQQLRWTPFRSSTSAGSGHPTSSMSAADVMAVLVGRHFRPTTGTTRVNPRQRPPHLLQGTRVAPGVLDLQGGRGGSDED